MNAIEQDRFKWERESSRFFEKKRRKKLFLNWTVPVSLALAQFRKSDRFRLFAAASRFLRGHSWYNWRLPTPATACGSRSGSTKLENCRRRDLTPIASPPSS
jgi:hypothetical protein